MAFDAAVQTNLTVKPSLSFNYTSSAMERLSALSPKFQVMSATSRDVNKDRNFLFHCHTGISFYLKPSSGVAKLGTEI